MTATGTEARVCQDIADRQQVGLGKYGTSVEANPLGLLEWYKHHYTELLDAAVYVKRIIEVMEGVPAELTPEQRMALEDPVEYLAEKNRQAAALRAIVDKAEAQSTTLEDGSVLTASMGNPQNLNLSERIELRMSGFAEHGIHPNADKSMPKMSETFEDSPQEAPWYPDDSGEWVEVNGQNGVLPKGLSVETKCRVLFDDERVRKSRDIGLDWVKMASEWFFSPSPQVKKIVAYKVVK